MSLFRSAAIFLESLLKYCIFRSYFIIGSMPYNNISCTVEQAICMSYLSVAVYSAERFLGLLPFRSFKTIDYSILPSINS
jgi:hypothetical protein